MPVVEGYPWDALEQVAAVSVRAARAARRHLETCVDLGRLGQTLSELTGAEVSWVVTGLTTFPAPPAEPTDVELATADGGWITVSLDADLVGVVLGRVLGRESQIVSSEPLRDESIRGALAAIAIEAARRTGAKRPLATPTRPSGPCLSLEATVLVDDRPYSARARASITGAPTSEGPRRPQLRRLGELPISVPLVVATSTASGRDLASLRTGDAWLPGPGWTLESDGSGTAALAAPARSAGWRVDVDTAGNLVIGGESITLALDEDAPVDPTHPEIEDAALDAPVVVRVEMGSVSLTAREWSELRAGDVVTTGRRVAEPVVLRVAGREVARGELVNVDGEVGVRIRELNQPERMG